MTDEMRSRLAALEAFCYRKIPVAAAMRLRFASYDGEFLEVRAPLAANLNHHGTVFGGSQYAIAAVAGWGIIKLSLEEIGLEGDAVITTATASYRRPVKGDFTLTCRVLNREQFLRHCGGHRHASVEVEAEIHDQARLAMSARATFYVTLDAGA